MSAEREVGVRASRRRSTCRYAHDVGRHRPRPGGPRVSCRGLASTTSSSSLLNEPAGSGSAGSAPEPRRRQAGERLHQRDRARADADEPADQAREVPHRLRGLEGVAAPGRLAIAPRHHDGRAGRQFAARERPGTVSGTVRCIDGRGVVAGRRPGDTSTCASSRAGSARPETTCPSADLGLVLRKLRRRRLAVGLDRIQAARVGDDQRDLGAARREPVAG